MSIWIKNPLSILAENAGGGIVVDGARIVELVPSGQTPQAHVDSVYDAGEHVVIPGMINTHHHFFQTLTRAFPPALNKELYPWLGSLFPFWKHLTPEMMRLAVRVAMAELLLSGCTTVMDHHYLYPKGLDDKAVDIEAEEARALGLRAVLTRGSMDQAGRPGDVQPESVVQPTEHILLESERILNTYHETGDGAMLQIALAPCTLLSCTQELMRESARLARRHGALLHTHMAETTGEVDYCVEHYGCRSADYMEDVEWLANDVWLGHGIHFDDHEIAKLGKAGVGIAHCPSSNMILASGTCRATDLERAGCSIGLGVDGSASNDCSNLMQEVRQAFFLQRLATDAQTVTHADALRWATLGSAKCLGRANDLGSIEVGKQADLALFKLDELRFSGHGDPLAAIVLCGAHRADRVMVAGRWVVEDGAIPGMDIGHLIHDHTAAAKVLQTAIA
ncbi:hydroxyatrazine ethylaminohydrolase protein [Salinisphaera shabanensis E1L3A]|uniref:Hydroxyatrazine ethylaminohydrolase protein n=1 Tax=Salinisphaera shabanensis E1L3A TaxID=1033802 RepID=U2EP69_9GAMM|nr:8-oxoguanine deaminase [Salinisphaera shabanensis]ERJ19605.1 hydroxyatrazine ethylaminohydrolase protein [Salinisphaera shabanensis E1L3A]